MSKLYLFGIGGTGARVMRSLTMLLASGVDLGSTKEIIPVLIDPDLANGDLTRTIELMDKYQTLHKHIKANRNDNSQSRFFGVSLDPMTHHYRLPVENVAGKTFAEYIDYNALPTRHQALVNLLFSDENLATDLEVGFKGNPNMGSVVLNSFNGQSLSSVLNNFQENDRIFIISSIFGGTGAAGFPLLVKTLREAADAFANSEFLKMSTIGAITVLPYFGLKKDETSKIKQETFLSKTKAALSYYEENLNGVDVLYYITDELKSGYENVEGSKNQKNDAHFVEMAAALAVVDFAKSKITHDIYDKGIFKEFATEENASPLNLRNLCAPTQKEVNKPLTQLFFMGAFYEHSIQRSLSSAWTNKQIEQADLDSEEFKTLEIFLQRYMGWLQEMAGNNRSFKPFDFAQAQNELLQSVEAYIPPRQGLLDRMLGSTKGHKVLEASMADVSKELKLDDKLTYTLEVFSRATEKIISKNFKF